MMNVGICLVHTPGDMPEKFAQAQSFGFHHCQLVSWQPSLWTDAEAQSLNALCLAHDITITALWCGWEGPTAWNFIDGPEVLGIVPPAYRHARLQNLKDGVLFAKMLGTPDLISHMGFIPENPSDPLYPGVVSAMRSLCNHAKNHGVHILLETGQETPITLLRLIEDVASGNLFINLDPANLLMYGKANPIDALDILGPFLRGVHAKDGLYPTNGRSLGRETKVGDGRVNFPALLNALKAANYRGSLSIEHEIKSPDHAKNVLDTKHFLDNLLAQL